MDNLSLRKILETHGFSKSFDEIINYTVKEGREALVTCFSNSNNEMIFIVKYGGCDSTRQGTDLPHPKAVDSFGKEADPDSPSFWNNDCNKYLNWHTHPSKSIDEDLGFSEEDIDSLEDYLVVGREINAAGEITIPVLGTIVIPSDRASRANSLLFMPKSIGFSNSYRDVCENEPPTRGKALKFLRNYGQADLIDFKLRDGIWQPAMKDKKKLENYIFNSQK